MSKRWIVIAVVLAASMMSYGVQAQNAQTPAEICEAATPVTHEEPLSFDAPE